MAQIKTIGRNGQISLGKEFAGQNVLIENPEYGVWTIKIGKFIPNNEEWLQEENNTKKIDQALDWVANNEAKETNLNTLQDSLSSIHDDYNQI